jgi:5-(carboxyamino)imidazole ribonucleotide synthase
VNALAPGSVIGILGGGQLARMLALAAARLGLNCHIFAPEKDSSAFAVSAAHTIAPYTDEAELLKFAQSVSAVTFEFENVPVAAVQFLEQHVIVRPGSKALAVAQDRLQEKQLARDLGAMTAEFRAVLSLADLQNAVEEIGLPAILKTTRFGYDGKGQAKINSVADVEAAWGQMKAQESILESFVHFKKEISVICARGSNGHFAAYEVSENIHQNHILHTSTVPAAIEPELAIEAVFVAQRMAESLDYVGVMGVEFFVGDDVLYVNEIAPRVHNSGHWTMDGCLISQFEQHMRAVAGWSLGATYRHSDVVMTNLLGDESSNWPVLAAQAQVGLHLYGKAEARPFRKMGHFNRITPRQA